MQQNTPNYISVTELNQVINLTLEQAMPVVYFEGEISELKAATSGHLYMTIKDERSQLSAVMWAGMARTLTFKPAQGAAVLCQGKPNVYHVNGRLQMVVVKMLPAGQGALQQKFLELKNKLEKEGFFAPERKRKLPFLPKAVGVVTSSKGAVIHDIMVRVQERMPCTKVYLVDVRVQGEGAAKEIAEGIRFLDKSGLVDVIITGRGGGSLEDLWAFNEEIVVKAIFACRVPVVSAVGHEVDVTLADLVADVRAPTPTAAAEMILPRRDDLLATIEEYERRLFDYDRWILPLQQQVDELEGRLERRVESLVEQARLKILNSERALRSIHPQTLLASLRAKLNLCEEKLLSMAGRGASQAKQSVERLQHRLESAAQNSVLTKARNFERLASRLEALSPKRVLERGFSVVEGRDGILRSAVQAHAGELLKISLFEGTLQAEVREKSSK